MSDSATRKVMARLVKKLPPQPNATFGERMADHVAAFGGSWAFIITFICTMVLWIAVNSAYFIWHPFDPYPFMLFNLILSCLAALQAPIIMMSQNRMETRDRLRNETHFQMTQGIAEAVERIEDAVGGLKSSDC